MMQPFKPVFDSESLRKFNENIRLGLKQDIERMKSEGYEVAYQEHDEIVFKKIGA